MSLSLISLHTPYSKRTSCMHSSQFRILALSLLSVLTFAGCSEPGSSDDSVELARVPSPDSLVDAVVTRVSEGGATVPFSYRVYIVPRGTQPPEDRGFENFAANRVEDLTVQWRHPKFLEIRYKEADIYDFSNYWRSKDVQNFGYLVELRLVPPNSWSLSAYKRGALAR